MINIPSNPLNQHRIVYGDGKSSPDLTSPIPKDAIRLGQTRPMTCDVREIRPRVN
jgi:hypothetical protein